MPDALRRLLCRLLGHRWSLDHRNRYGTAIHSNPIATCSRCHTEHLR